MWFLNKKFSVLFYCASYIDEVWVRSTIAALYPYKLKLGLLIYGNIPDEIKKIYQDKPIKLVELNPITDLAKYKSQLVVSASTEIPATLFAKQIKHFIHMPHSLVSLHAIYPANALEGFNCLFACGKHHVEEFIQMNALRQKPSFPIYKIGYGKLDLLLAEAAPTLQLDPRHILIAPSWGDQNVMESIGIELIQKLLKENFKITLRPHPLYYIARAEWLQRYKAIQHGNFTIEHPGQGFTSFYTSSILITDYSGVSFEYFLVKNRKIIFVDTPKKIINSEFSRYNIPPVEINLREKFGQLVPAETQAVYAAIINNDAVIPDPDEFILYNKGKCGEAAANKIMDLLA
jgi:YidC/Oxa1 family membrane protein insertase